MRQSEAELKVAKANVQIKRAAVERARAELENSRSALVVTAAVSEQAEVAAKDTNRELVRMRSLHRTQSIPDRRLEQVEAARDQAVAHFNATRAQQQAQENAIKSREAHLKMEIAQLAHAEAQVEHRLASLKDARIELEHTFIRSPVDGVVISRDVDVGQTVVARFQAPLLFTIAQDLRSMQVESSVDEADIGRILAGRPASFTVDAFPGRKFSGVVDQIRKAPVTVQNVVTYTVIIVTDNTHLVLLPGMTATVRVVVQELNDVLKVPNAALRFRPPETQIASAPGNARGSARGAGETTGAKERLQRMMESLNMT
jgi:HlyD family secretion protein